MIKTKINLRLIALTEQWMKYICIGHHKDRDCHWYIEVDYAYGEAPTFKAMHFGYIAHKLTDKPERKAYEDSEKDLIDLIKEAIANEKTWVDDVLKNKKQYGEDQVEQAELFYKIFK